MFSILCRPLAGPTIALSASASDTIGDIRTEASKRTGVPAEHFYLVRAGTVLDDDRNVLSYGICSGSPGM